MVCISFRLVLSVRMMSLETPSCGMPNASSASLLSTGTSYASMSSAGPFMAPMSTVSIPIWFFHGTKCLGASTWVPVCALNVSSDAFASSPLSMLHVSVL